MPWFLLTFACTPGPDALGTGTVGEPLGSLVLDDQHSQPVDASDHRGTVLVIDVSAMWCQPCMEAAETQQDLADQLRPEGIAVWSVLVDDINAQPPTIDDAVSWAEAFGLSLPVLADVAQEHAFAWEIVGLPTTLIVDGKGIVTARNDGLVTDALLAQQARDAR